MNRTFPALLLLPLTVVAAGDPYDYKELVATSATPTALRKGLFDFGKDGIGWLELVRAPQGDYELELGEITNAVGTVTNWTGATIRSTRVRFSVTSSVHTVALPIDRRNTTGYFKYAPAIRLPPRFPVVMPFRYVEVIDAPADLAAENLRRQMVHYPIDMSQSSFDCDNAILNEVYEFCKYSILATSFCGMYVDGDRERTPYEGDAYINQLGHYAIENDYSLARKTCEWLVDHGTWPTEWRQHMIMMFWADWMWTGDTRPLARHLTRLIDEKSLSAYARPGDGLLLTGGELRKGCVIPNGGDLIDWPEEERDGFVIKPVNGVVNAFYYRNLRELSEMAVAVGRTAESEELVQRAKAVRKSYRKVFLDGETGLFVDGEGTRHSSLHVNAAALAFGLVDDEEIERIVRFLERRGMVCSVYFAQYLLDALCVAGREDLAVRLMSATGSRSWKGMIDFGSTITMEAWSIAAKSNLDLNHAWGAVPLNVISRCILGVTPLEPGFSKILIRPRLGGLGWMRGTVPTAKGAVSVSVDRQALTVETPAPARIDFDGRILDVKAGRHRIGVGK